MKEYFAIVAALLILAIPVMAQQPVLISAEKPQIHAIGVLGKGLAIDSTNPMEFKIVKFALAKVRTSITNESTELKVGLLYLDEDRYKIRDFVTEDGHSTGDVYSNDTKVGSYELSAIEKNDAIIWAGTLTLSDVTYNVYVMEGHREIKSNELALKAKEYCEENPERCKGIISGLGRLGCDDPIEPGCSEKIKTYCQENVNDSRCQAVFRAFCSGNMDDQRCRDALNNYCKNDPDSETCYNYKLRITERYCDERPLDERCVEMERKRIADFCLENPDDAKCEAVKKTQEFLERTRLVRNCYDDPEQESCEEFCENHPLVCKREQIQAKIIEDVGERLKSVIANPKIVQKGGNE